MPKPPSRHIDAKLKDYLNDAPILEDSSPPGAPPRENTLPGYPPPPPQQVVVHMPANPKTPSDPIANKLEGTHKRVIWIVGICAAFGGAIAFGWNAREAVYTASHFYYPAASAVGLRADVEENVKRTNKALERLDKLEERATTLETTAGELRSNFDHATKPGKGGKRTSLFPPTADAGAEGGKP